MSDTWFYTPFGDYSLVRQPSNRRQALRAWDAADEYLLHMLAGEMAPAAGSRVLILNDSFGALAVALHEFQLWSLSDSVLAQTAMRKNFAANGLAEENLHLLTSLELPVKKPDLVLIKVPRTLALLEYQLLCLRPLLEKETCILVAGMMKGLPSAVWKLLESLLGPTTTFPGRKKAKLMQVAVDPDLRIPANPYPSEYKLDGTDYRIINHANVFSRERLDIGTRFFLQHLPIMPEAGEIIDLGCGNGVLALLALQNNPGVHVHCVDESYMAVASARATLQMAFGEVVNASFHAAADLSGFKAGSTDLVLCNPPFHQQQVVGTQIAQAMFHDARRVLRQGGELWVVGNRHLGYHKTLNRLFGNLKLIASNRKFVVLRCARI